MPWCSVLCNDAQLLPRLSIYQLLQERSSDSYCLIGSVFDLLNVQRCSCQLSLCLDPLSADIKCKVAKY